MKKTRQTRMWRVIAFYEIPEAGDFRRLGVKELLVWLPRRGMRGRRHLLIRRVQDTLPKGRVTTVAVARP